MDIKETISVPASEKHTYDVFIGPDMLAKTGQLLSDTLNAQRATLVSNDTVWALLGDRVAVALEDAGLEFDLIVVPDGEESKNLETAGVLFDALTDCGARRRDPIVALGGGVTGDLAGFVAATYMRGVPFVNLPTTLLAMVDSSIGGKTAVDLRAGKNLVGAFNQPAFVLDDISCLNTLPEREIKAGIAETIKTAFLAGREFFDWLVTNLAPITHLDPGGLTSLIQKAVRFKGEVVAADEFDRSGRRAILNYGHTLAHALETDKAYHGPNHGEAVAIGMVFAALLSEVTGLCPRGLVHSTEEILRQAGLPTRPAAVNADGIVAIMNLDKKNTGDAITFVLLQDIGRPVIRAVPTETVRTVLEEFINA